MPAAARGPWTRLRHQHPRGREAGLNRRDHVPAGGGVAAGDEADPAREARQRALAGGVEETLRGQRLLQPLDRGQVLAEPEPLQRERAEVGTRPWREELGPAEHVDPLALGQVELERVEGAARDRRLEAGAVVGVFEREEDARPVGVAAQLRHLALDPERRQAREPVGDAAVEAADGEDLLVSVQQRLDLHHGRA